MRPSRASSQRRETIIGTEHGAGSRTSLLRAPCELFKEAYIGIEEQPNIRNAVPQHRDPLGAHAPRVACVLLAIDVDVLQHGGMYHAGAQDLHPAGLFAGRATRSAADLALHIHLA